MDNSNAQLQNIVNTPVTNVVSDPSVPSDISTADLNTLKGSFETLSGNLVEMGGALSNDVQARQQLLIGNNFAPGGGTGVGDLSYDTYYESGIAEGANKIKSTGTNIALNEGMRRAKEAAEARAKKAQEDYNAATAKKAAEAQAKAQAAAAQQSAAKGKVQNVEIDQATLKKHGVSSAEDLATLHPDIFEKELQRLADNKAGVTDKNVWKHGTSEWYGAADRIYQQFGATPEQRQDERSGKQTQASKDFWARKDVGTAFTNSMLNKAGYSSSYYKERNAWVDDVQAKVYNMVKDGGPIDKINQVLKDTKLSFTVQNTGNQNAAGVLTEIQKGILGGGQKINDIIGRLKDGDSEEFKKLTTDITAALELANNSNGPDKNAIVGDYLRANGYQDGAAGMYNRVLELTSKSGVSTNKSVAGGVAIPDSLNVNQNFTQNNPTQQRNKMKVETATTTITLDAATAVTSVMGLSAEDIVGLHSWSKEDPASLGRYLDTAYRASTMPLSISDGSLVDLNGNQIEAGTAVVFQMPGSDELESYKRLVEILEQKPVIYDDGTASYGWTDIDDIAKYYDAYVRDASYNAGYSAMYGFAPNDGTGKATSYNLAYSQADENDPSRDKASKSAADKLSFGGKQMRNYETNDDIVTNFQKLAGDQKREFYEFLIAKSEYKLEGAEKLSDKGKAHGIVNDDISAQDAQGLLMIINAQQNMMDPAGKPSGTFKPADLDGSRLGTFWEGVGVATQQGVNFFAGAATGLFGTPAAVIDQLNGNAAKEGYISPARAGYEIAQGGNGKGLVTFADGNIIDLHDMREQENMAIFSGFSKYFSDHAGWYGAGETAQFVGSLAVGGASGALIKATTKVGANALRSTAGKAASKLGIKVETKAGAGTLKKTTLESKTLDVVDELAPASAAKTTSKVEAGASVDVTRKLSPTTELFVKNVSKAQLLEAGATEVAYNSVSRWVRAAAVAAYNGGDDASRKLAANLVNLAHEAAENGARFAPTDAFRYIARSVSTGSGMSTRAMYHLAQEAKWYAGYVGWQFASEVGERDTGKYARYLDDNGNFDFKKAASYQGEQLVTDVAIASLGYGLLGPGLRALKSNHYEGKLNKWTHIHEATEAGTEKHIKANKKIDEYYNKANKFVEKAGAKFLIEGDSPRFRDLLNQAEESAGLVVDELSKSVQLPKDSGGKLIKALSIDEAVETLSNKVGFKSVYLRNIAALKVTKGLQLNKLRSEMPTITNLDPLSSLRAMREVYTEVGKLGPKATEADIRKAEIRAFEKFGVPAAETKFMRAQYDKAFKKLESLQESGDLPAADPTKKVKSRQIYFSMAALDSPVDARVEDSFLGLDVAAGITSAPKAYKERSSTDMVVLLDNSIERMTKQQKSGGEMAVGANRTVTELNVAKANPVTGLHSYLNKIESDESVSKMRKARYARWDVIKVVDDDVFDANYSGNAQFTKRLNRRTRRAGEYKKLVNSIVKQLTFKNEGAKASTWTTEKTNAMAESYLNSITSGVISPSDIRFIKEVAKNDELVDNFLEDHTGLHLRSYQYEKVYKQAAKDRAVEEYTRITGEAPTAAMIKELDNAVAYRWSEDEAKPVMGNAGKAPKKKIAVTEASLAAKTIADDTADAQHSTPAQLFNRLQDAQDRYIMTTSKYEEMLPEYNDTMFGEKLLAKISFTSNKNLIGKEYSMLDLVTNNERVPTILATAPKGMAKKIEAILENSKVVFAKGDGKTNGQVGARDVYKIPDGEGYVITIYPEAIRKTNSSIEATLGHEFVHVLDMVDIQNFGPKFFKNDIRNPYYMQVSERRAGAYSELMRTEKDYVRVSGIYEKMLKYREEALPDMIIAAERSGVKLDYKKVMDDFGKGDVPPVVVGDSGVTYMRRSDFEKSDMSQGYENIGAVRKTKDGKKNDSEVSDKVKSGIDAEVRGMERNGGGVDGSIYLARDYSDMIRTYGREGGEYLAKEGVAMKIGQVMNEITQLQLAAGYSIFNAYTARQFISSLGATVFTDPKQAVKLFNVYGYAGSIERTRKYLATPEKRKFIEEMSLLTGDTTLIDVTSDTLATTAAMRTGVADEMTRRIKDAVTNSMIDGKKFRGNVRGQVDAIHRIVDDPTFKRFLPILMIETMQNTFVRKMGKDYGRYLNKSMFAGDEARLKKLMMETYEEWQMFWGLNVGTRAKQGGISKFQTDRASKFLSGQNRGTTFTSISSGVFFALQYRLTNFARFANGLISLNPKTFKDSKFAGSRSLLFSGLAIVLMAQIWNEARGGESNVMKAAKEFPDGDPNNLYKILADFGSMGRFDTGFNDIQIDPFFSVFTMQNSVFREGMALFNTFAPPDRRIEGVQGLGQELNSLLLSPLRAAVEVATNTTYFGYSIYGEGASAFNDETGEPIPYSPLDNFMAIMGHMTGLDRFGLGANLTYEGAEMKAGRNARGEIIGGSGLFQHEYIEAATAVTNGDWFTGLSTALELPLRSNNLTNKAMSSMNGWFKDAAESYYKDYKKQIDHGNLSKEEKDELAKQTMSKMMGAMQIWNDRYGVLDNSPHLMERATKMIIGFMSDQWDDGTKRVRNAYWAAKVDALGGFDKKSDETEEEYEKRKQQVSDAYGAAAEKERAARDVLRSLGYDPSGYDYEDDKSKRYADRDSINFQFKQLVDGKIQGQPGLKDMYYDYNTRIQAMRSAGNRNGAAELEAEYISKYEAMVSPYVQEYGEGILLRNRDFVDLAAEYVIIPSADFRKYSGTNGKKYWLQDRYGVGYKDSSALISDDKYMDAYQRLISETMTGNSALAQAKAEDMIKHIASGKYTVSDKQYNQLVQIFSKLRNHNN